MERGSRKGLRLLAGCLLSLGALAAPPIAGVGIAQTSGAEQSESRRFIVTLRDDVRDPAAVANEHAARFGADVAFVYSHALRGYAATFAGGGISDVARDGRVARVEPDGPVTASATVTQSSATWGLDRIDQATRALSGTFKYTNTGTGVTAYVIDTGLSFSHSEFGGRATVGYDAFGGTGEDCNGHGTHVGGTLGGATYGVAKGVSLVGVRVLDCAGSGSWSGVIAGVDWVTGDHDSGEPAVANMSLGGGASVAVDTAVRNSIVDGVTYAVAAGNGNAGGVAQDACKYSPARVGEAMTIGATDKADRKASWSNYGACVDWFAPGVDITSAWSSGGTKTISGTSMASPHTAGVAALYVQSNPAADPASVRTALFALTSKGVVSASKTATNHLLFTNL